MVYNDILFFIFKPLPSSYITRWGCGAMGLFERVAFAVAVVSLLSFVLNTAIYPSLYPALSSMLTCILSCLAVLQGNLRREIKELEKRLG
jgi:hypothetical protein